MKANNLRRTVTKKVPTNDEALFRQVVDQFWQDVFREIHGSFIPAAARAYGEEKFAEHAVVGTETATLS